MRRLAIAAVLAALAVPAAADDEDADCAFLERAFQGIYQGLRAQPGDLERVDPELATLYALIQNNVLLMANGLDCDMGPMVEVAREQLEAYGRDAQ